MFASWCVICTSCKFHSLKESGGEKNCDEDQWFVWLKLHIRNSVGHTFGRNLYMLTIQYMCGVHIVYFLCVFVCLRFALVCIVFVTCMGPRMRILRRTLVVRA